MGMLFPVRLMKNSWLLQPTPFHTPLEMRPPWAPGPERLGAKLCPPSRLARVGGGLLHGRGMPLMTSGRPSALPPSSRTQSGSVQLEAQWDPGLHLPRTQASSPQPSPV